jgi:hypothetical protein
MPRAKGFTEKDFIQIPIEKEDKELFYQLCRSKGEFPAAVLREFVLAELRKAEQQQQRIA